MRLPLLGGAYSAQSAIANAQRCINLYPELNPKDSPVPITHYPTPGLKALVQAAGQNAVRCLFTASNEQGYAVIGSSVYSVSPAWTLTKLGDLAAGTNTQVSMVDNGTTVMVVDGSPVGYTIDLASNAFAQIVDPTGTFSGADRVDYLDTFILFNIPNSAGFGSTHSNGIVFDPLYFAEKTDWPDNLTSFWVLHREIWLLGAKKSEIWYDAGNPLFPFAELTGAHIEHGCVAKYSVASEDLSLYWVGQDLQGQGVIFEGSGYSARRVSTHALEQEIQSYPTLADAIGYCYQENGHIFYVVTFPSADKTWAYDRATQMWHQRGWLDQNGVLHRQRGNCFAYMYNTNIVGDWGNGTIYRQSVSLPDDDGEPIVRTRSFPHSALLQGAMQQRQYGFDDGHRIRFDSFSADIDPGAYGTTSNPGQISLRWSDTKGKSWGNPLTQSLGAQGQFNTQPKWTKLGMARDRVFELSWSVPASIALNGAWVEAKVMRS